MTDPTMALMDYLSELGLQIEDDLREEIRVLPQSVIESEVTQRTDTERFGLGPERLTLRNGHLERAARRRWAHDATGTQTQEARHLPFPPKASPDG